MSNERATQVQATLQERIHEGLKKDPMAVTLQQMIDEKKAQRFWIQDGLIKTKGD